MRGERAATRADGAGEVGRMEQAKNAGEFNQVADWEAMVHADA